MKKNIDITNIVSLTGNYRQYYRYVVYVSAWITLINSANAVALCVNLIPYSNQMG